jgi:hypothetical protein
MPGRYEYATAHVDAPDPDVVLAVLVAALGGRAEGDTLDVDGVVLDVRRNPDRAFPVGPAPGSEFLAWPVVVEAEGADPDDGTALVDALSRLLTALWEAGHRTVVAADFEDELPWSGGIARISPA